ncbi:MAG: HesA/MoeB/ThiF family protein [Treponema sp.]|nr:HesA/MoeB/ThiF family protein [Treponema sp.]
MEDRYSRQLLIEQISGKGQEKLSKASVFVVGAGGLGSPALTYLAAAGIGRLGFIDSDTITLSNLNRQFLYCTGNIGQKKADSAKEKLVLFNDKIIINSYSDCLTSENAETFFNGYDIVLGAVDSLETRHIINKACLSLGLPYIDGGLNGFSGCIFYSNPCKNKNNSPCLNCLYPEKSEKKETTGVLGTTAGIIGTMQANIAILLLLGLKNPLEGKLLIYDGIRMNTDLVDIKRNENCPVCGCKTEENK